MAVTQSPAFKKAAEESKQLTSKPSNEDLLEIYALYKVGTGENIEAAPAPGMFDLKGKAKLKAWRDAVDDGISAEDAQEKYVAKVEEMKTTYGFDASKKPEAVGSS
ncbi:acyl CoA binding protein-domain-containing protein [Chaetomium fimeti]|jgi:diazepam-binding inhibitor (GABA receptor modulating acyl-CoA-binding protein)|uniref:Acyl CoA binding protein-domain-containing protein n=1 Tax=Chaetomium fimeti TaxID=1854472 RepID=A0AAE0HCB7_9PEZI|nr:acyl CoA binding protein-domain-containing protein [Chaetomium fimeti]